MDRSDPAAMRELLEQYREHDPRDEQALQAGYAHLAGRLLGEAISGQLDGRFDLFARVPHPTFPGGRLLRSPLLALGMLWYRLKDRF